MPKKEEDMHGRLQRAALALFAEHGYDQTTAAQIAARAGVTERTFFRYFPDKREVLFEGEIGMQTALIAEIACTAAGLGPLDILFRAFKAYAPELESNRQILEPRFRVIGVTPALREREGAKMTALAEALASALQARGVPALRATLAAQTAMAAVTQATIAWLDDPAMGLRDRIELAARALTELLAEAS
jgi:AcrR family transcriptional regulator